LLIGVKIGEMMVRQVGIKGGEGSKVDGFWCKYDVSMI
jgi:hypothetical protein